MKGENDDLVMSMAIATWLYDASAEHGKDSQVLNQSMLAGMSVTSQHFNGTSNDLLTGASQRRAESGRDLVSSRALNRFHIPPEFAWIYK